MRLSLAIGLSVCLATGLTAGRAFADNQTPTVSPVSTDTSSLSYTIKLRKRDVPTLPTLQSFASGQSNGLWVIIGGRTNGLHNFTNNPVKNFPPAKQNKSIHVIDPATGQKWSRRLDDSTLTQDQVDALSTTATENIQIGETLYVVGGYGYSRSLKDFKTYSSMTAFDLPTIVKWVRKEGAAGKRDLAKIIRQTDRAVLKVTGGQLLMIGNRAYLTFGQLFDGGYGGPTPPNQGYTGQVRSFTIVDDGTTLSISDIKRHPATPNLTDYRRRDYNLVPFIDTADGKRHPKLAALAGVFTETTGMFTVPVEINRNGVPSMADPTAPSTFKQAMNGYNCATLPIFDSRNGESHAVLFGGISYVYYRPVVKKFVQDSEFPFINDITTVVRKPDGSYSQILNGEFPVVKDADDKRLRFGAEAGVFLNPNIPLTNNGMVDVAKLKSSGTTKEFVVGWIYGGIAADAGNNGNSTASNLIFDIVLTPKAAE